MRATDAALNREYARLKGNADKMKWGRGKCRNNGRPATRDVTLGEPWNHYGDLRYR